MEKNKNNKKIMAFLIILATFLMSIGYASVNSFSMDLSGNFFAKAANDLFISDVILLDSNDDSKNNSRALLYNKLMFNSKVELINSDSYVTFKVTLFNNSSKEYVYVDTIYDDTNIDNYTNSNIKYTVTGLEAETKILPKETFSLYITFEYLDKNNITDKTLTSYLKLVFDKGSTIMEKKLINKFAPNGDENKIVDLNGLSSSEKKSMFSNVETTSGGIYRTIGSTGKDVYVFRGVIDNNYVNLGGYLWRILQIDEDGNLRLILNSTTYVDSIYANYGENDTIDNIDDVPAAFSFNSSVVKTSLISWYEYLKKNYSRYIVESKFCQDYSYKKYKNASTKTDVAYFTSYINIGNATEVYSPTLNCDSKYLFTGDIGLVSADELVLAGASFDKDNTSFFLYNPELDTGGAYDYFWTLSPSFYDFTRKNGDLFMLSYKGRLVDWHKKLLAVNIGVRPVITVDGNYEMSGDGTKSNPYKYVNNNRVTAKAVDISSYEQLENKQFFITNVYGKFSRNGAISTDVSGIGLAGTDTIDVSQKKDVLSNITAEPVSFVNKTKISDSATSGYKYQIKSSSGKYLRINDDSSVEFTDEETYLKVIINTDLPNKESYDKDNYKSRVIISNVDETMYLNYYGAESTPLKDLFAGWNSLDKNAFMNLYEVN